ncbi:hypothetical protein MACH01_08140 [Thalassospira tepidiphila]|nr:hypothetical protein MACH01_08140 [Thalassospira tepidiphila]
MQGGTVENFGGLVALLSRFPGQPRADVAPHPHIGQVPKARNAGTFVDGQAAKCQTLFKGRGKETDSVKFLGLTARLQSTGVSFSSAHNHIIPAGKARHSDVSFDAMQRKSRNGNGQNKQVPEWFEITEFRETKEKEQTECLWG